MVPGSLAGFGFGIVVPVSRVVVPRSQRRLEYAIGAKIPFSADSSNHKGLPKDFVLQAVAVAPAWRLVQSMVGE
jgi:hypothetical protein